MMSTHADIETDAPIPIEPPNPPYPRVNEEELQDQLIAINEELDSEDLEVLKFLCYDYLPASKLEVADNALSIFENLKKGNKIHYENVDFLLECLWLMHRKDLIRKLGFVPEDVKPYMAHLNQVTPFRKLLLELSDDITRKEFETLCFYLDGKVKKKRLQNMKNMLELFVFLEREGLISHTSAEPLVGLLQKIKRADLVDHVNEMFGKPAKPGKASVPRIPPSGSMNENPPNVQAGNVYGLNAERNAQRGFPPIERAVPVQGGYAPVERTIPAGSIQNPDQVEGPIEGAQGRPLPLDRSASAGTMSAPSSLENEQGIIPEDLLRRISQDLQEAADDFGMELGYTNPDIAAYNQEFADPAERVYQMIKRWQRTRIDQGQVAPGLKYALDKLGFKRTGVELMQWVSSFSMEVERLPRGQPAPLAMEVEQPAPPVIHNNDMQINDAFQGEPQFQAAAPPEPPNNYMSLQEAQIVNKETLQQTGNNVAMGDFIDPTIAVLPGNPDLTQMTQQLQQLSMAGGIPVLQNLTQIQGIGQGQSNLPMPELNPAVLPQVQGQEQRLAVVDPQANDEAASSLELPVYKMTSSPKGYCVIINNRRFNVNQNDPQSKVMPERRGTEVDAATLKDTFEKLDFIVEMHENLTDTDMMQLLVNVAHNVDHKDYDCLVCCILSHGVLNHLYGTNGRLVAIRDLTGVFQSNRCPSLAGKPKLFFLQACQGRDKMAGGEIEKDATGDVETDNDKEMIPNESDFLVGYATVPGYVSFRSRNHGSWYIRKLCEALEKYSERHDLMSILVKVNEEVSRGNAHVDGGIFKQTPAPVVTLRKKLYFFEQNRRIV